MEEAKKTEVKTKEKKKMSLKIALVLIALIAFGTITAISLRAEYLNFLGIGEQYITVFEQKVSNKYTVFGIAFVLIYLLTYILNKFIKRGLKKFFEDEKKEMPKLPNKSLSLILGLIGGAIAATMLSDKLAIYTNAALFGQTDPIFNADISYYMFSLPFIKTLLIFLMEVLLVAILYTALYYVITLNTFFDGVDGETLKKNTFLKQEIFILVLLAIVFCTYIFISSQDILTGNMLTIGDEAETELTGAGKTDVTIKLWGYRILTFVVAVAIVRLLIYIKKQSFKQSVISVLIVPVYLIGMFIVMIYFQTIHVGNNELDNEKEYIAYNINNTKTAYGIDIDQQNINNYSAITSEQVSKNENVINNVSLISEEITLNAVTEHQENSGIYSYEHTFLSRYEIDGKDTLMYITPRETSNDSTIRSYNNRTLKYTHGYSVVATSTVDKDSDGYAEYILSDFISEEKLNITEPRIYFGLETDSTIMINTKYGKEYDYPLTASKNEENSYEGKAGLNLGFLDRLVLAISEKNYKLVFSSNITEETKIINNRNIIERAKKILPYILYDEEPYLVITDEGRLVWVLDGYTRSNAYPYSQTSTINIKGYKEEINYIRNSVKVLIDAYDGTTKFYITDSSDPIIMTYRNIYPDLFIEEELPQDIQEHLVYPEFLYEVQSDMINKYHDISEDTLYRADDIWQITPKASSTNSAVVGVEMEPYYTMLKTSDKKEETLGLLVTYNKYGKQNITSYLVGTVENGKSKLSLYKFNSESNVAGIMQLNNQIEEDATITKELEDLNTSGTRLIKDMIIVPIDNTLIYIEPIYQVMLNDDSQIPVLKKVIVASGNIVAIGDNLSEAISNLVSGDNSVDLEFINIEDIDALVDSVIKANNNLKESLNSNDFEMIGKDISSLQVVINQLETARSNELEKEKEEKKLLEKENIIDENVSKNEDADLNFSNNIVENKYEGDVINDIENVTNEISNSY